MKRDEIRKSINERPLTDFVQLIPSPKAGRNMYVCPVCGSGTGPHGTGGCVYYPDTRRIICFPKQCFTEKGQDNIGALRIIWKCGEAEAMTRAGYTLDDINQKNNKNMKHQENKAYQENKEYTEYTSFYKECHENLLKSPEALEYLHRRGISDESIKRFNLGYCAAWKHKKAPNSTPTRRIIIPRTKSTYQTRNIDPPRNEWEKARLKEIQGTQKDLFNLEALGGADIVFICEGELDAISLYQAGAAAVVGIGTTVNTGRLLEEAKKNPDAVYILALDNDPDKPNGSNPGKEAQRKLAADLEEAGILYLSYDPADIYGTEKDANEAFVKYPERLKEIIIALEDIAQIQKRARDEERAAELRKRTGEGMLEDFLLSVTTKRDFEPIATGISDLDRAIYGGFIRKTLVMLGAAPGMGKTALAQWIFENMATAGHDVLYINLEMSREQLLARSLSRLAWKYQKKDINAVDILRGYEWTDEQKEGVMQAAEIYGKDIAPHFVYNPDGVTNHIESILKAMQAETMRIRSQGKPAPLICIDYLQLVESGERDAIEGMKQVIFRLKKFAETNNTVVFAILANNRASNRSGTVELESGRDTSSIEYSADLMLGLSYTAIEDRYTYVDENEEGQRRLIEFDLDLIRRLKKESYETGAPIPDECNYISLKVLKNRFGEAERRANLIFDGKHATFNLREYQYSKFQKIQKKTESADGWEVITGKGKSPWD